MKRQNITYTINADIDTKFCSAVERYMKSSKNLFVSFKNLENNGMRLSVGCHQICSKKSQVSSSASTAALYT